MAKMALVIGVGEYEPSLTPLPGSLRDVEAMQRVLEHPEVGGFDEVKTLLNPAPQKMQEAIETLFSGRKKDDLVLLFFSGHGVKDDSGKLYLATRITRKTDKGELVRATAVPTRFVQDIMSNSRSRRQVVILDCCFSGAFAEGWLAKDDGSVDVKTQLGGEGRAVLTSSTSTQYSFEQEGSDLSTYTRYLVEGIETGAADLDSDGVVSVDELHEYAKGKVQEAAPAMKPEIYAVKEGYKIHLSQAPTNDPKLRYRKEVERCASQGKISTISRYTLDALQASLKLLPDDSIKIEDEVLKPYQEYQEKLLQYKEVLLEALKREQPLNSDTYGELKRFQKVLNLRDEDTLQIEGQVNAQQGTVFPSTKTKVTAPTKTPMPPGIGLLKAPAAAERPKKPKLMMGAGVVGAIVLMLIFVRLPQPNQNTDSSSSASPTETPTDQMSAQELDARGDDKYNNENYQGAIEDYNLAIQLEPDYAEAYYDRAWAKKDSGDNQGAITDYNLAIQLQPDYANAYLGRGIAKANLGDYQGAIADYDQAIELKPNYTEAYKSRGRAKNNIEDYQGAIADYDQAIKLKPGDSGVYNSRGIAKKILGDYQGAIADYDQVIKLKPSAAYAYYNRGNSKRDLGDTQGAIADYQKAAELYQEQGNTDDYQDALEQLEKLQ